MGDDLLLRSRCPGSAGCFCAGAEHVYVRERTVTPPRSGLRSSRARRSSNRALGVETVTISKTNTHSATISATSTASVEVTSMVTRRSTRAGSAQPVTPAAPAASAASVTTGRRSERLVAESTAESAAGSTAGSTTSSERRRISNEYLAYSSDDEFEEFISKPKTDYTYARSVSYNTISPQHVTPPNMSRRCLHSPGTAATSARDERYDLSLSRDVQDFSFSREVASRITSTRTTTTAASTKGSLYHISRGLDVDSGDEDVVENNNISKSYESYKVTQDAETTRWTITSVLLAVLYPVTYLWATARGAGRRLLVRRRATDTATTAPPQPPPAVLPGTVEYRRWMRGLPQLDAEGRAQTTTAQRQWSSRTAGVQAAPARRDTTARTTITTVTKTVVTTFTRTVTTVITTVVMILWWPVEKTTHAAASAGRHSASWVRSVAEAADVPRRSAQLMYVLSPKTWAQAVGSGAGRAAAAIGSLSPIRSRRSATETSSSSSAYATSAATAKESGATRGGFAPISWLRSACLAIISTSQWAVTTAANTVTSAATGTVGALSAVARGTAGAVGGVAKGTASVLGSAASGTAGALSGAAKGTAGALSGAASGTAGAAKGVASSLGGAVKTLVGSLASAAARTWSSVWPGAAAAGGRHGTALAAEEAGARRRRLCLCLLPLLLLLLLLLLPLLWGLYCEEDPAMAAAAAANRQESVVLTQLKAAPVIAWVALRDTAAFVGTSTIDTASSFYGYLSLLGSSALLAVPSAPESAAPAPVPAPAPAPAPVVVPVAAPAPPSEETLAAVYARIEELQAKLAALQTDFQSCRAASEAATQPAAVRAALGLGTTVQLVTSERLAAAEQRQAEQLSAQLAAARQQLEASGAEERAAHRAQLEARLAQLETTAGQLRALQDGTESSERRVGDLTAELGQLQQDFSDLHRTLLAVQESLKQVRSCCNRTDPDWSALLSQRLQSLESDLEGRLQGFAATIKQDLTSESVSAAAAAAAGSSGGVSKEEVVLIAREALAQYDADKTGKFDYALESAGGSVISTKCTESYNVKSARISVLGIPLWYPSNNPRTIIQPSMSPGECFAFRGQGYFVIALSRRVEPTEFVLEHISRNLTPTAAIDSAPRNFTVLGLRDGGDQDGILLGRYVYRESGPPLQVFPAHPPAGSAFSVVELRVHDNWGHRDYTCLYRFRVHGRPVDIGERDGEANDGR